ncbi:hypothetical protein Hanom_Chr10g00925451 [Helianthus anomalus]
MNAGSELGFVHILLDLWTINAEKLNQEWLTKSADLDQPPLQTGNSVWKRGYELRCDGEKRQGDSSRKWCYERS